MNDNRCGARTKEERRAWLKQAQGYPLKMKVALTEIRIREWYEVFDGKVYVAFSGGKDSTVMLDIIWSLYPDVPAVFANTGNELESVLEFVKTYGDKVTWVEPKMSFTEIVKEYGYPVISKKMSDYINRCRRTNNPNVIRRHLYGENSDGTESPMSKISSKWWKFVDGEFDVTNKCCGILKNNPTEVYRQETGRKAFVGTMAEESQSRLNSYINAGGCNAFDQKDQCSRPIMFWTEQDVLEYIDYVGITIAGAYGDIKAQVNGSLRCSGDQRTGCKLCLFGIHLEDKGKPNRIQRLADVEPESYRYAIEELGYDKVMDFLGVDWKPFVQPDMQMDLLDPRYDVAARELIT
jgi:3'-phosphoadenosine 5'-phosphosulfate sulfotransferase (PAPS reductase)/FAD synthetase